MLRTCSILAILPWVRFAATLQAQEPLPLARLMGPIELDGMSEEAAWQAVEPLPVTISP